MANYGRSSRVKAFLLMTGLVQFSVPLWVRLGRVRQMDPFLHSHLYADIMTHDHIGKSMPIRAKLPLSATSVSYNRGQTRQTITDFTKKSYFKPFSAIATVGQVGSSPANGPIPTFSPQC